MALKMTTGETAAAIARAGVNDLHASHGGFNVRGEGRPDGTVEVGCLCGVSLTVRYVIDAPVERPRRRIEVE